MSLLDGYLMMEGGCRQSPRWRLGRGSLILIILILFPLAVASNHSKYCAPGLDTSGVTYPRGDINLEEGESLEIFCVLNPEHKDAIGRNSSNLVFYRNDELVSPEFVNIVNSTTLRLYVKEMPASENMYYCKLRTENPADPLKGVCLNTVFVGYKPQEVQNFTCTSHNWQSLTCSWKAPKNDVKTAYRLIYRLPGRAGGRIQHSCPDNLDIKESRCFWDSRTVPQYRQPYDYYFFTVIGTNILGNMTQSIKFYHYAHVIPAEPVNLVVPNKTSSSILLKWYVPPPLQVFPPGIVHKIEYQHQWESRTVWKDVNTSFLSLHDPWYLLNLTNLKYANTLYDIRVYMRSAAAIRDDVWSTPAYVTVKTGPTVPGAPPKTDIGSFEIAGGLPNRDVYIYWQQIPDYLQNGIHFEYNISEVKENGTSRNLVPHELSRAYAKFKGLSFNSYTFTIASVNKEGRSVDSSRIYIPSPLESPGEPLSFTKIAFGEGIYELSWKHPKDHDRIVNYTIFWCNNDRDRPYQCAGYLNWTHVPRNIQIINITVPEEKIYQFAISANSEEASSGMVWASCTVIHNKAVGKMKSVWINLSGTTFIEVGWKLECSDRIGLVQGFRIYYCPIISPYNLDCKAPQKNTTIEAGKIHGRITNLKPYTTYMVAVSVLTKSGEGLHSDPLYNTTFEGAPDTPPLNVTVSAVTNTSMKVSWLAPESMNGVLRYYEVFYNEHYERVENKLYVVLENLKSYTNYSVSVAACTVSCSMKSEPVVVRTEVGIPGTLVRPTVNFFNSSYVQVTWDTPEEPAGITSYYELRVGQSDEQSSSDNEKYQKSYTPEAFISIPDCETEGSQSSTFEVRAVNIAPGNVVYRGNWSETGIANCFNAGASRELQIWVPVGVVILIVLVVLAYISKMVWTRCKEMQDVEVKLPPGLDSSFPEKEKDPERFGWPTQPFPLEDRDHRTTKKMNQGAGDEELLLHQKERHGRNPSGDSSGCSSAHDSVSSALTSGTQISSDSGADVDRCAPSPDMVFRNSSETTLRLRNVPQPADNFSSESIPSDMTDMDIGSRSIGEVLMPQGKDGGLMLPREYSRVGMNESGDSPQPGGYVSLANVTTPSVISADPDNHFLGGIGSTSNSNYIAHPRMWLPKDLIDPCVEGNDQAPNEGGVYEPPGSYCRMAWRPGTEHSLEESNASGSSEVYPERPSVSDGDAVLVRSPTEGYVTVASLGGGGPNPSTVAENARCHSLGGSPNRDYGLEDGEVMECSSESVSPRGHVTSPEYVSFGCFAKDESIHNSQHEVLDPHGGASSGGTTTNSLTNEES